MKPVRLKGLFLQPMGTAKLHPRQLLKGNLLLLGLVLVLFFLNFSTQTLFFRPRSYHQWRQSDCLSITKNYYEEGMDFFSPKIHYQGTRGGKAVSEMPILNYTTACLWKVFGEHEFIYRLLEYFIFLIAVFVLFNTLMRLSHSLLLSFLLSSILLTSPLLAYYSLNFIADVPALSMAVISFCLLWRHTLEPSRRRFFGALISGTLAVLMKASALTPLGILLLLVAGEVIGKGDKNLGKRLQLPSLHLKKPLLLISSLVAISGIVAWYRFALYYNSDKTNNVFLLTILPIWEMSEKDLIYNFKMLFNVLFPIFLNKPMFLFFLVIYAFVWASFSQLSGFFKAAFAIASVYFIGYLLAFFQVFSVHDYYLTNLMILPVVTFMAFSELMLGKTLLPVVRKFLLFLSLILIPFNSLHCAAIYRLRNIKDDKMTFWCPTITEEERNLAAYIFWDYGKGIQKLEHITPVLREHGIRRTDKVLVIPDGSFNIALYMMDQKGFPIARHHFHENPRILQPFLKKGIQYAIIADTSLMREPAFTNYAEHFEPWFETGGVQIFKFK